MLGTGDFLFFFVFAWRFGQETSPTNEGIMLVETSIHDMNFENDPQPKSFKCI